MQVPFVDPSQLPTGEPKAGWVARFFHSPSMTFAYYEIAADAEPLHEHRHPQEEVWNVLDGGLAFTVDGVERVVGPGEAAVIPPDTPHSARVLSATRAIVVDHPTRDQVGGVNIPTAVEEPGET
jgi:quercetin dioxygenase-like cupin family protein